VTDSALSGTPFTSRSCPYITRAFARLRSQSPTQIEVTLLRYEPKLQTANNVEQFFEILRVRVNNAVASWINNADLSGLPPEIASQIPESIRQAVSIMNKVSSGLNSLTSGIETVASGISNIVSGISNIFFKSKTGGSEPTQPPQDILQTL